MKCKSWSNKFNNFVARHLKSIKINGQQQQQIQQQQQQQQPPLQFVSTSSTMPAMPKEKATAVSLRENFSELNLKDFANQVNNAMATTATSRIQQHTPNTPPHHQLTAAQPAAATLPRQQQQQTMPQQSQQRPQRQTALQQQQNRSSANVCGCGAASATAPELSRSVNRAGGKYLFNGHSSPLAAAVASASATQQNGTTSPQHHTPDCCRSAHNLQQNGNATNCNGEQQLHQPQVGGVAGGGGTATATLSVATANAGMACASSASSSCSSSASSNAAITPPKKSPKDFIFGRYIGEGSFSNVYLAVDVNTKREYAIKVCEKRHILRERKQEYVRREREVLHMMTNVPGFVNLSCTFQDSRSLYFVMTYAKNGDLLPYINKVGSFDVDCTRHYAAELVLACEQMHRRNVVHRDLKPENILLDEDMHALIADFGSAKVLTLEDRAAAAAVASKASDTSSCGSGSRGQTRSDDDDDDDIDGNDANDTGSDEDYWRQLNHLSRRTGYYRKRRGSFVGTAQYVSPEVLQNGPITPAADLWALGCIVYQMISGLPPFRGSNDYVIFKEILACDLDFPQGFDKDAEDLVRKLLKVQPDERLGAQDFGGRYESIRSHPFFAGINFATVRQQTPPPIYPYLPGVSKDEDFRTHYRVPENLEPGLDEKQLTRLLGMELGTSLSSSDSQHNGMEIEIKTVTRNIYDLSDSEKQMRLEQQKSDKWHVFADNEVILKKGFINKRKGLFARKRMLLLTTGPRLIYIDPVQMVKKGEIPWSADLRVEPRNFKIFFVHTPNRTYYLEDPDAHSLEWEEAIDRMRQHTYLGSQTAAPATPTSTAITTTPAATYNNTSSSSTSTSHRTNSPTHLRSNGSGSSRSNSGSSRVLCGATTTTTAKAAAKTASN